MGPRLPAAGRQVMAETRVATVSIDGEKDDHDDEWC
jgi:hypothetical protein